MASNTPAWLNKLRGKFLVFDGPDGSGKTTQCRRFASYAQSAGIPISNVREPGGTPIGEFIRKILLDPNSPNIDLRCEMLLYMASRAQLTTERIAPALKNRELVLADRFISSTLAYQGAMAGLPEADIRAVARIAIGDLQPHLIMIFDVNESTAASRLSGSPRGRKASGIQHTLFSDRMETRGLNQHRIIRQSYLDQARLEPDRHLVIDATADENTVFAKLLDSLRERFE
jgi:dTMP kinase